MDSGLGSVLTAELPYGAVAGMARGAIPEEISEAAYGAGAAAIEARHGHRDGRRDYAVFGPPGTFYLKIMGYPYYEHGGSACKG